MERALIVTLACLFAFGSASVHAQRSFVQAIGVNYDPQAVSADGTVVTGIYEDLRESKVASGFRWTPATGPVKIRPEDDRLYCRMRGISPDGGTIVGGAQLQAGDEYRAVRWTSPNRFSYFPVEATYQGEAVDAAIGGRVIVGSYFSRHGTRRAFRWSADDGFWEFGRDGYAEASGVSYDGSVVVGETEDSVFRWSSKEGVQILQPKFGGESGYGASPPRVSGDGRVVVGVERRNGPDVPWIWREETGKRRLPSPGGRYVETSGVNYDGSVIVGSLGPDAAIWIDGEVFLLHDFLAQNGTDLSEWREFFSAADCSRSGRVVVGFGRRRGHGKSGFRVLLPLPNEPPIANAGPNVNVVVDSERGAIVRLDGRGSSDPDGDALRFRWSGPRVRFDDRNARRTTARFPVGTTIARLTAIDEAGARASDTVRIRVRLKNGQAREHGAQADTHFAAASQAALRSVARSADESLLAASQASAETERIAVATGSFIRWSEQESYESAALGYAAARDVQSRYGLVAARGYLASFVATGDDDALIAAVESLHGSLHASADAASR